MTVEQIPVWLDCDPGHDDVFAILLAAYHPRIKLLGVSTVFGNAPVEKTTQNAASVLTAIGKQHDVPLHVGLAKALERPAIHAPDIHGESGLDGTLLLPSPTVPPSAVPALDATAAALRAQPPNTAWLVATGSLTNVGALLRAHPDLAAHLKGLSIMGGALGDGFSGAPLGRVDGRERVGNVTPWAEFNIVIDPEAAAEVFGNKTLAGKTTVVPLDLSHQVLATAEVREMLLHGRGAGKVEEGKLEGKTTLRTMLVELLYFFSQTYADVFGITEGPPLHDPLAVAAVLAGTPDEIPFHDWDAERSEAPRYDERFDVAVVTDGVFEDARDGKGETGRTVGRLLPRGQPGVRIPRSLDVAKFWDVIEDCVERADAANAAAGRT
ncbi:Inosine/uridine-preferring nucleoside hydrolase [Cordyceps fumosorosea ARSEF 2679]|uniref:Inosine/uridine-preferring nucleoside hydrolase n=1 Tax=Cordyceps fumosorosea (strain ARSEF 2679) TaxID=1081104 RepID=A0A168E8F1_CORFA|nr:Inosine/uridine-preferring nucleoside hydrolase [Cordyceps fumosorosea ARSEF 2679]OAA73498.1 Inosine/uridine-preferring nucleoside hydrolase [Cordyceps fumosorosea ARSEF 2679]